MHLFIYIFSHFNGTILTPYGLTAELIYLAPSTECSWPINQPTAVKRLERMSAAGFLNSHSTRHHSVARSYDYNNCLYLYISVLLSLVFVNSRMAKILRNHYRHRK